MYTSSSNNKSSLFLRECSWNEHQSYGLPEYDASFDLSCPFILRHNGKGGQAGSTWAGGNPAINLLRDGAGKMMSHRKLRKVVERGEGVRRDVKR